MVRYRLEKWNKQRPDLLGFIVADKPLFQLQDAKESPMVERWVHLLKSKKIKKDVVADKIWVSWTGLAKPYEADEAIRVLASRFFALAANYSAKTAGLLLNTTQGAQAALAALQGIILGFYQFAKYKTRDKSSKIPELVIYVNSKELPLLRKRFKQEYTLLQQVNLCRDLVNEPANVAHPRQVTQLARQVARKHRLAVQVLDTVDLRRRGYNGIVSVGQGSVHPPYMVVLRYRPSKPTQKHLALVGKGITFDSGGYSLKPSSDMWEMISDMAGAATVLYAMAAIAVQKPRVKVTGILCLAENLVDAKAYRPGDIFKAKNGKTVQVTNTDAEGRLALTDGLYKAGEEKATHIMDLATLTGSMIVSLGTSITGFFSTDTSFSKMLQRSAKGTGELFWELPLHNEYKELLKTPYADINNVGDRNGGSIQAALFLREFVPPKAKWMHLDIAGTAFNPKKWKYFHEGATGIPLRTIVNLARVL